MVAQLLRLRLAETGNLFRLNSRRGRLWVFLVVLLVLALWALALGWRALADIDAAQDVAIIGGSVLTLLCAMLPFLIPTNPSLDPRGFTLFGIRSTPLAIGLYLAALVSFPGVLIVLVSLTGIFAWPDDVVLGAVAAILGSCTAVLAGRVSNAVVTVLRGQRHGRGIVLGIFGVVVTGAVPAAITGMFLAGSQTFAHTAAHVLAWTPLGAAWALPGAVGTGHLIALVAVAVVTFALLWWAWQVLVRIAIQQPLPDRSSHEDGLGWFAMLPDHPAAAIAARSVTYWARDPRYVTSTLILPILPVVMVVILNLVGVPWSVLALLPLPVIILFLAWIPHNDLAQDSSALWLHIAAGVRGRDDRIGRVLPILLLGLPLITIGGVLSVGFAGNWMLLPGVVGVCLALLLGGLGISSFVSARTPYAAVAPGDSPFEQPQGDTEGRTAVYQGMSLGGTILVALPALLLCLLSLIWGPLLLWAALVVGVVFGGFVFVLGIRRGGAILDARGAELLDFVSGH